MRSPSTWSFRRSTPWVDGCWGPKLSSITSPLAKRESLISVSASANGLWIGSVMSTGLRGRFRLGRLWRLGRLPAGAGAGHGTGGLAVVLGIDRAAGVDALDGEVLAQRIAVEAFPEEDAGHV